MNEENISLWKKNVNDLTVGDTVAVTLVFTVGSAVLMAGIAGVCVGVEKVANRFQMRKTRRQIEALAEV